MPTCPACGYNNDANAINCARCSHLLSKTKTVTDSTIPIVDKIVPAKRLYPRQIATLGAASVALYVDDTEEPLILEVVRQAILGRHEANSRSQPRVDLTPYRAYEKGVSRLHAIIRRGDTGLMVEDLASTNGTWLNDSALEPYIGKPLKSGDRLRLGKLIIEIYLASEVAKQASSA
jgi:FHA domain